MAAAKLVGPCSSSVALAVAPQTPHSTYPSVVPASGSHMLLVSLGIFIGSPLWGFYPLFVKTREESRGFAIFEKNGRIPVVVNKVRLPKGVTMGLDSRCSEDLPDPPNLLRFVKKYCAGLTLLFGLLVFFGMMLNSLFRTIDDFEIGSVDYEIVAEIGNNYPELTPFIRKICEDGKITGRELSWLKGLIPAVQKERVMKEFK